jgi:succinate dehydrogenase / fumarate reductase cytochrome b subunit
VLRFPFPARDAPLAETSMDGTRGLLASSIGKKLVAAVSGLLLLGFLLAHLAGNLQVFAGQEKVNAYAATLRGLGPLLWVARLGLIAAAAVHVLVTLRLAAENRAARGSRYAVLTPVQSRLSTRGMLLTGLMVLLFAFYHLAHFTWHAAHSQYSTRIDPAGRPDVYSMLVGSFREPSIALPYVAAMILLGLHLSHGLSSFFQTMGWRHPRRQKLLDSLGPILGGAIALGYIAIPVAVQAGMVVLPEGVVFP